MESTILTPRFAGAALLKVGACALATALITVAPAKAGGGDGVAPAIKPEKPGGAEGVAPTKRDDDGSFPTAEQVGGQVFPTGLKKGDKFPTDFKLYDEKGGELSFGDALSGKRTLLVFFISAAPASVEELKKIDSFVAKNKSNVQVIYANADTVGVGLEGGKPRAIPETVRTVNIVKRENGLTQPVYVAPNDVFSPDGLSNRLGFRGLPTSYLVGADGKVEKQFIGVRDWKPSDL